MDPITLIVTALAAGAALGVQDTASGAVKDAYASLKALVMKRFAGRAAAERVLAEHEDAPQTWQEPLTKELVEAGADRDIDLVAAARALMSLVDAAGSRAGKYTVDVRGGQGVQVGVSGRFATPIAVGRGYEGNSFQCPSETTSTVPSVTLMAV
jgi:hypothetical protein